MVRKAALILLLAAAPAVAQPLSDDDVAWLTAHPSESFDVYPDGVWVSAGSDVNGTTYGIRLDDLKKAQSGDYKSYWVRGNHKADKTRPYRTSKFKQTVYCPKMTVSDGTWIRYRADGSVLAGGNGYPLAYNDVIPGSIGERWAKMVCAQK